MFAAVPRKTYAGSPFRIYFWPGGRHDLHYLAARCSLLSLSDLRTGASVLQLTPVWRQFYIPVIVLALGGLAQSAVNLVRPDWTWLRAATRLVSNVVVLIILRSILSKTYPFVTAIAGQGTAGAHYQTLASTVNICIAVALAGTGIGLFIGLIFNAWSCLSELRRFFRGRAATASRTS